MVVNSSMWKVYSSTGITSNIHYAEINLIIPNVAQNLINNL